MLDGLRFVGGSKGHGGQDKIAVVQIERERLRVRIDKINGER